VAGWRDFKMARLSKVTDATYTALQHIRETCLIQYDSLFTPERKLWSLENFRQSHALFVERFDEGKGRFLEMAKAACGADDDIFQLTQSFFTFSNFSQVSPDEKKNLKT
jgi:hypothetical protein